MKICLIGYGKMGKAIEQQANNRGHIISSIITRSTTESITKLLHNSDVVIEFTQPESALQNIRLCMEHNIPIISGTTGWTHEWEKMLEFQKNKNGKMVWASNFSVGVNILFQINQKLAQIMNSQEQYSVAVEEIHHTQKKDAPSGTALTLTEQILNKIKRYTNWHLTENKSNSNSIPIHAIRKDSVIGFHEIKYSSEIDEIKISHNAFTREGFALGAVLAAEWIINSKCGVYNMGDVLGLNSKL
ncbi:MAG: 4-hydroxy-tetrahydrodipicolinate reductase [Saprospiraceae bacterium]|nr:4-hydroxy-tetrahydrodipicolinate reductase [Saprospiraceae bacterium]